jgi:D-alanine transfer protein
VLAEKIAAASEKAPAGRKVAISLSPSWFFHSEAHHRWYIGNFSAAQASALVFSPRLSLELKRDFARRMLDYPDSVEGAPLLEFALRHLVGERPVDLALFRAVTPLARLQSKCAAVSDHFAFAWHILHDHDRPAVAESSPAGLNWDAILANERLSPAPMPQKKVRAASAEVQTPGNWRFAKMLGKSREWSDLELLLRVAREMELDPLLLSIPIDYPYYESIGVSRESLDQYRDHLHALAAQYGVAVVDFAEHQDDAAFFADHNDHLSAHGWLYMNRALDFFYHGASHQRYFAPGVAERDEQLP